MWIWLIRIFGWGAFYFFLVFLANTKCEANRCSADVPFISLGMLIIYIALYYLHRVWIRVTIRRGKIGKYFKCLIPFMLLSSTTVLYLWIHFFSKEQVNFIEAFFYHLKLIPLFLDGISSSVNNETANAIFLILIWTVTWLLFIVNFQITITKDWFSGATIEDQLIHTENAFLKTQLNPHLFKNMLNNVYALVALKKEEALNAIEKLQTFMEYMLYKSNAQRVPLEMEINYIKDLLEIESYRLPKNFKQEFVVEGDISNKYIAPLILLPFIENIFSHGDLNSEDAFISIKIEVKKDELVYTVRNKIPENIASKKSGGIGLKNLENRLNITYPLFITKLSNKLNNNIYQAKLEIFDLSNHIAE
jgi:hypothetical protein